jgi:hypothetical protein
MNLAASGLLFFILVLPGILFRWGYLGASEPRDYSAAPLSAEGVYVVVATLFIQVAMILSLQWLTVYRVDFRTIGLLAFGSSDQHLMAQTFTQVHQDLGLIAGYHAILWPLSYMLGVRVREVAIARGWDLQVGALRLGNNWYYILTGRDWNLEVDKDFDYVWLDALVVSGSETTIYSGVLSNLYFSADGKTVESMCLSEAQKWATPNALAPTIIPGNYLIIKYGEIRNLNISFYKLESAP